MAVQTQEMSNPSAQDSMAVIMLMVVGMSMFMIVPMVVVMIVIMFMLVGMIVIMFMLVGMKRGFSHSAAELSEADFAGSSRGINFNDVELMQ